MTRRFADQLRELRYSSLDAAQKESVGAMEVGLSTRGARPRRGAPRSRHGRTRPAPRHRGRVSVRVVEERQGSATGGGLSPATADVAKLAALPTGAHLDEAGAVAGAEDADVVVYGANLTFVDVEALEAYAWLELAGQRPAHVEYVVDGIGDGGAAVVHRDTGWRGRTVAAVLRRGEADRLRAAIRDALRVTA